MVSSVRGFEGPYNVVYRRSSNTAWRTIVGETIVVHLDAKEFFGLNETAADVWNALDGAADTGALSSRFGIPPKDVEAFFVELRGVGLVDLVEDDTASSEVARDTETPIAGGMRTEGVDPPRIVWREEIRQVAATCAFLPGQNPLCVQVPMT